jgi:tRNA pseudouridine38-40 synthase
MRSTGTADPMELPRKIKMVLQYDGTSYHGWQRQKGDLSIQEVIEEKIQVITGGFSTLIASGRTDAGVHALGQVCHFLTNSTIAPEALRKGLNSLLPDDILIEEVMDAPAHFHARYSARSKVYEYRVLNRLQPDPFLRFYSWHVPFRLNIDVMKDCLSLLQGSHDFSSFRSSGSENTNPTREMIRGELHAEDEILRFLFEADGFLRHMVRNIVGTLVDVGRGKWGAEEFRKILESKDRQKAGVKSPPQGLYLVRVRYDPL